MTPALHQGCNGLIVHCPAAFTDDNGKEVGERGSGEVEEENGRGDQRGPGSPGSGEEPEGTREPGESGGSKGPRDPEGTEGTRG